MVEPTDAAEDSATQQSRQGAGRLRSVRAQELAERLREDILEGVFASGSLPNEHTLTESYGATRNTVREALRLLVGEGLLVRRPGSGTRIAAQKFAHSLDRLAGLAETLVQQGEVSNEVLTARWERARGPIARRLHVKVGSKVLFLERLRRLDGEPLSLDSSYITAELGKPLLKEDLATRDVFALLEEISGAPLGVAEVRLQAVNAEAQVAQVLEIASGDAIFVVDRLTRLADGRPVDVETISLRGDRISFASVLHRSAGPVADDKAGGR